MGEKSECCVWFSLRRVEELPVAWRCIVYRGVKPVFVGYGGDKNRLWREAWDHLLAVQEVTL